MAKNYVKDGNVMTCVAPAGGVVSGTPYLIGAIIVVAMTSAAAGANFEGALYGVYKFTKVTADTPTAYAKAYLKSDGTVTTTASGNTLIGVFTKAYGNGDTIAEVRLNGVSV